jgi:hypothetical protein
LLERGASRFERVADFLSVRAITLITLSLLGALGDDYSFPTKKSSTPHAYWIFL